MILLQDPCEVISEAIVGADARCKPFPHWLLTDVLPFAVAKAVAELPVPPPPAGDTQGRRETHNSQRVFLSPAFQAEHPVARAVAAAFQEPEMIGVLEARTGARLSGHYLRIEYCRDGADFWLEPHTDIGAKAFTMLIYLSASPEAENWGTDIYDVQLNHVGRAPGGYNKGLIFIPGEDTWHGVEKRAFSDVRKSLIVNYVVPDWRSRHELAFPDETVQAGD